MNDSPQKENGYTPIANEIMDALAKIRIKGEARQVLDFIIRKTYGWNKKEDFISLSQFVEATKLKRPIVCRSLKYLLNANLIIKNDNTIIKKDNEWMISYGFNKHYTTWKPLSKKIMHYQKRSQGSHKNDNRALSKMIHTKDSIKDTIQKTISSKEDVPSVLANAKIKSKPWALLDTYKAEFQTTYHAEYVPSDKDADLGMIKTLMDKMGGFEPTQELIKKYFSIKDDWFRDKITYSLEYLCKYFNKIKVYKIKDSVTDSVLKEMKFYE